MKLREDNIDIYNNSAIILNRKTPNIIKSWIIILIILSLLFIAILFIPFNIYTSFNGYVMIENDISYINIIDETEFPIKKKDKLYIKDKKYKYEVINIDNSNILLKVNLEDNIKINNNIVVVNILKDRTSLFEIIRNKIKKGFDL